MNTSSLSTPDRCVKPTPEVTPSLIYWDHCATTPVSPSVVQSMSAALTDHFANPSSAHRWGARARDLVEDSRVAVAMLLGASPREIFWTSGATEANNLALFGAAASAEARCHIISQVTEHSAVLEPLEELDRQGHDVTLLTVNAHGVIDIEALRAAICPETRIVSLMYANNEIGALQPIAEVGALLREIAPQCLFHVDCAQAVGKLSIDLKTLPVDLLSLSAHKLYGPKGVGALYIRRSAVERGALAISPLLRGGEQERRVRPGTLATHQIVGLGVAAHEAVEHLATGETERLRALNQQLLQGLQQIDSELIRRGHADGAPHVLSVTVSLRTLILIESKWRHVAFSQGSACHSLSSEPSHVLRALGLNAEEASRTIRFGLGRATTAQEIEDALTLLRG